LSEHHDAGQREDGASKGYGADPEIRVRTHSEDAMKAHVEEHGKKWRAVIIK
jgi:hypothetical protein